MCNLVGSCICEVTCSTILNGDCLADGSNQKWVGDISYIWTSEGRLYLAILITSEKKLLIHGVLASMPGKENYFDSATVEMFFKSLKVEWFWRQNWLTRCRAIAAIFHYINGFYNPRRCHSYLGGISLLAFEAGVA